MESVIRKIKINVNGNLLYKSKQLVAYADDINCLARAPSYLEERFDELERVKDIGLRINEDKTKIMFQGRKSESCTNDSNKQLRESKRV